MQDNSAFAHVFQDTRINKSKIAPIRALEPVLPLEINIKLAERAEAIKLARILEKKYKGNYFIVMPFNRQWQIINYEKLSPNDKVWADEVRGSEAYYE